MPLTKEQEQLQADWQRLGQRVDAKKSATTSAAIQWIYDNAGLPPGEIDPDKVPSLGVLRHLRHVQMSEGNYAEFLNSFMVRTIPNKSELERQARFSDDGRSTLELIDQFDREVDRHGEA